MLRLLYHKLRPKCCEVAGPELVLLAAGVLGLSLAGLAGLYTAWLLRYLASRLVQLQAEADVLRAERGTLSEKVTDLEQKLQITLIENAMLSAKYARQDSTG